ncbi:alpha hydrolase [Halobacteriales archaeon SW_5_68_122]|nr:MAG: alpha hydrolase [Halobacteriales archaeon SW_5_68_122]
MECGLLFSGGKDSALAALLLDSFYDVTLVTAHFGVTDDWRHAAEATDALGFAFEAIELDESVADSAAEQMHKDGYPRRGIQQVHEAALEAVAAGYDAVADGTRRDDRVPTVSRAVAQSLEDRHGVDYVAPLSGFGRGAVDRLVETHLEVRSGPSEEVPKGDYETELRTRLRQRWGAAAVAEVFPAHEQTRVVGRSGSPAAGGGRPEPSGGS